MDLASFKSLREIAYDEAGIDLSDEKQALVAARVEQRLRVLKLPDAKSYVSFLQEDDSGSELVAFLDAISTNFTSFFREPIHFEELSTFVKQRMAAGQQRFRIWSAASSSGEEPWTIAMTLSEAFSGKPIDWKLLGTDISTRMLKAAKAGEYRREQVEAVPAHLRARYFTHRFGSAGPDDRFTIADKLRGNVSFGRLNLATPPYPLKGPLDVVFCRNVMIYFDELVRQKLLDEIGRLMAPGGMLFISHTETLNGIRTPLQLIRSSVFRMPGGGS